MAPANKNQQSQSVKRVRIWYGLLLLVMGIFLVRLFYVQVIQQGHYKAAALSDQLKQYDIPATRGVIKAHDGTAVLPIVLNQKLFVLYADPVYIKKDKVDALAAKVQGIVGGDAAKYARQMQLKDTRYVILAKKLTPEQAKKIAALKSPGLGTQAVNYRTYPQGSLLAQTLGFVSDEGKGVYGIEQALNDQLNGTDGQLKAITDAAGVPLAASKDNVQQEPKDGDDVVLTIDLALQQQLETILQESVKATRSDGASAMIMEANTGAIKAMANYPTYDPAQYANVKDPKTFQNDTVSHPIEVGSSMKTLTTAAALDMGAVRTNTSYYDPASWVVDGFRITNIEEDGGAAQRNMADVLNYSLNTGVTWQLMQMGGGKINQQARERWYDYLYNRYQFGKLTGVEQGYESEGLVPGPENTGSGINLTYANMSFGQAMTATPVQMAGALAATVNGGTYYQPRLVEQIIKADGTKINKQPKVIKKGVVSPKTSAEIVPLMEHVISKRSFKPAFDQKSYIIGGKTGTAQIAKPGGGYSETEFNGTYAGIVGGDKPEYVIVVATYKPRNGGYAGSAAAQPIFAKLAHVLIDGSYVAPRGR